MKTDYLILGSGIAGLTVAIKLSEQFPTQKIVLVTKSNVDESNTKYAQGGIAVVTDGINDNFDKHIKDTLLCGDGLCNREVVELVVKEGPNRLKELIDWGTNFDCTADGKLDLAKEGGHSNHRVVHHKDQTGREIERAILAKAHQKKNIKILDFHFAIDFIIKQNKCLGATILDKKKDAFFSISAQYSIIATGGIGQIYKQTTNPLVATGDGIAMAIRANARVKDMEFIQFHPTALYMPKSTSTFLISEAVRGFGAYLKNKNGYRFMFDYDARGELASRDIVSRSIETEMKKSNDSCVYLDCTHLDLLAFKNHFPTIYQNCLLSEIDIVKDWIPVIPTQHYLCGGIVVDINGQTSIENLFACGECSYTGLHGANRLASNSLLEALVFANQIYIYLKNNSTFIDSNSNPTGLRVVASQKMDENKIASIRYDLQTMMQNHAGIVRNDVDLQKTLQQLCEWESYCLKMEMEFKISKNFLELKNLLTVSIAVVLASLNRTENRGSFYKTTKLQSTYSN